MMPNFILKVKHKIRSEIKSYLSFTQSKTIRLIVRDYTYAGDGIITSQFLPFNDGKTQTAFKESFELVPAQYQTLRNLEWRFHILIWAMNQTKKIDGDIVECGVWYGILSRALLNYFGKDDLRKFILFDSWGESDFEMQGPYKRKNYLDDIFDVVTRRFAAEEVTFIRGTLPKSLEKSSLNKISLLMIDLNSGWLEKEILEILWNKVSKDAIVYFDDYGQDFPLVRRAIDEFVNEYKQTLLVFPTGQAIIIKV